MCGILAVYSPQKILDLSEITKEKMLGTIKYRGLDNSSFWSDECIGLGHTRLSIIDLASGNQPMADNSGRYVIIFNGEVYNYLELKKRYEAEGACFLTNSDTEVILEGFKLKQQKVLGDLNGMFAFCIWDKKEKKLFVARDRLGKKPLYWMKYKDVFYFSSTIESFKSFYDLKLNTDFLHQMTIFGVSVDSSTVWQDIYCFPFASYAFVSGNGSLAPQKYWQINFDKDKKSSKEDFLEEYENILIDSIRIRLRSDVPLCLTFSGGVDSGTIACVASKKLNHDLRLFCIDYDSPEEPSPETAQAKDVAKILGLPLEFINYDYHNKILEDFDEAYINFDMPSLQFPLAYSHILYKNIASHAKVTLSGNGADEIFTGYVGDEKNYLKNQLFKHLGPCLHKFRMSSVHPVFKKGIVDHYLDQQCSILENGKELQGDFSKELKQASIADYYDLQMYMSLFYGARSANFELPDITGLSNQVEVRSPYLDYRMVEFAARLPVKYKIHRNIFSKMETKYLPKLYYKKYVPHHIAFSPKKGMGFNLAWHKSIAFDKKFNEFFKTVLTRLDQSEILKASFLGDLDLYCRAIINNQSAQPYGTRVMAGFMISTWLHNKQVI